MPLETANYISDLVPTNPLISDNIADGPSHFWLIKKVLQSTFPNIKGAVTASQDQLNVLVALLGSSTSDGLDLKGNLTVEGKALVPSVTDWTQKQAVPASDADGRYLQLSTANTQTVAGPVTFAEKLLTPDVDDWTSNEAVPAKQADSRYLKIAGGLLKTDTAVSTAWMDLTSEAGYPRLGVAGANGTTYGFYGIAKVNALIGSCLANNNPGISGALAGTSLCVNPADGLPYLAYNGNTKIAALALDSAKVNKADGTMSALNVEINGGSFQMNNTGAPGYATWFRDTGTADDGVLDIYSNVGGSGTNVLRITSDGSVRILGSGTFQKNGTDVALKTDLPLDANQRIQSFSVSIADGGSITFPVAFSGVPTSIQLQCMQTSSRITVANPTSDPQAWGIPSVGIQIVAGDHTQTVTTPITVWVTAIGPK